MASFQDRVIGALTLQPATYEEVEADASATTQAAIIVVAAAASTALGSPRLMIFIVLPMVLLSLLAWAIGAFALLIVGTKLFPGKNTQADFGQMLRVVGFARTPNLFAFLTMIPFLGRVIALGLAIWGLVALVVGVRQALDYDDTVKAVIVCVVTFAIMMAVMLSASLLGLGALGVAGGLF
jgi:Yip1 domain